MGSPNSGPFSFISGSAKLYSEALEHSADESKIIKKQSFASKEDALKEFGNLKREIRSAFKSFVKKTSSKYINYSIKEYENGLVVMSATKPGDVPNSYAVYNKICYKDGTIRSMYKDTFDNRGNKVHRHIKYPKKEEK